MGGSISARASAALRAFVSMLIAGVSLVLVIITVLCTSLAVAFKALAGFAVVIVYAACAAVAALSVALSVGPIWLAFGGDVPALLPAAVIMVAPFAFVMMSRAGWGGLLVAGGVVLALGATLPAFDPIVRGILVGGVLAALVFHQTQKGMVTDEQEGRFLGLVSNDSIAGVQRVSQP